MRLALLPLLVGLAPPALAQPDATADVPVRQVALFTSGVGYFEHAGTVRGDAEVVLRFSEEALNDVLKSLVVEDRGGRVAGVVYPSQEPVERALRAFAVDLTQAHALADVLAQLRGAEVVVETPDGPVRGTVVGTVRESWSAPGGSGVRDVLTLLTPAGLRQVRLDEARAVTLADPALQAELTGALGVLASGRDGERKPVRVRLSGSGARPVRLGYVAAAPVWKTSYRLVLPETGSDGYLQGWALVENPTESDWTGVELTLVSGRPVAFVQDLYTPRYVGRPVVRPADDLALAPQTYDEGSDRRAAGRIEVRPGGPPGRLEGRVTDERGTALPGANVVVEGTALGAATDTDGQFVLDGLPAGTYAVVVSYVGYEPARQTLTLGASRGAALDVTLVEAAEVSEVTVAYSRPVIENDALAAPLAEQEMLMGSIPGRYGDVQGGALSIRGGREEATYYVDGVRVVDPLNVGASVQAVGGAGDVGELFAYTLGEVTLPRRQSAMLPIVTDPIRVERVSVYDPAVQPRHPLRGVRLTNTTAKHLRAGPLTVFDEGYGGDALLPDVPPGRDRLLTFALDQDVLVDVETPPVATGTVATGAIAGGVLRLERRAVVERAYRVENRDDRARTVVVEHARQPGAALVDSPEPTEETPDRYRFRVEVAPNSDVSLRVREARRIGEEVGLYGMSAEQLEWFASADGSLPGDVRAALERAAALQRELAAAERDVAERERELAAIRDEQARIRGNMGAVDRESAYYRRLLAKLDEQETRIEALAPELDERRAAAEERRQELEAYLAGLDLD